MSLQIRTQAADDRVACGNALTRIHDWPTVYQLPAHSPDLNPAEGIWSLVGQPLAKTATHLEHAICQRLRVIG
jgi:hypothetical protein